MADERSADKANLIACLDLTEARLSLVVHGDKKELRAEFRGDFPGPWNEVRERFELARKQIRNDEVDWHYVEGVGLTKSALIWKRSLLEKAVKVGPLRRFLSMANSFLGSLSGPLPIVDFIKEYKEMVEASLKIIRRGE